MKTIEIQLYKFSELPEQAKQKAIDSLRDGVSNDFYADDTLEDFKEIGAMLGIYIDNIYYSGFWSQGDGACFTGSYSYKKGALKSVISEYPKYTEIHDIARELQELQKVNFYGLSARVTHTGRYYHELSTSFDISLYIEGQGERYDIADNTIDSLTSILREFMQLIYSTLSDEYDYISSDKYIKDYLLESDDDYTIEGVIY